MPTSLLTRPTAPTQVSGRHAYGLVVAACEALIGRRALHQLRRCCSREAFTSLARARESGRYRHSRIGGVTLRSPSAHAIEAHARVWVDGRWLACVIRLDEASGWQCSSFDVLG